MNAVQQSFNRVAQSVKESIVSLLDAAKRIFSPTDDDYPNTGVQPFEGDIPKTDQ